MSTNVLFGLPQNQLKAFEDAIAEGRAEIAAAKVNAVAMARMARELEGFISSILDVRRVIAQRVEGVLELIQSGVLTKEDGAKDLQPTFRRGIAILEGVMNLVDTFVANGGHLPASDRLTKVLAEVKALHDRLPSMPDQVLQHWTAFAAADLEEAQSNYQHGECLDLDEAFASLAGMDQPKWLRLVAQRKNAS